MTLLLFYYQARKFPSLVKNICHVSLYTQDKQDKWCRGLEKTLFVLPYTVTSSVSLDREGTFEYCESVNLKTLISNLYLYLNYV